MDMAIQGVCTLLQVFDMPTSMRFYRDVLGFELIQSSPGEGDRFDWGWLRLQGADLMLNTAYERDDRPPSPDPVRHAAHADTGLYFACADPDAVHRHLRAHGIEAAPPKIAPYGMKQLYVADPDGYWLCFQCPAQ